MSSVSCSHAGIAALLRGRGLPSSFSLVVRRGRFREEHNVELLLNGFVVLNLKAFCGRGPYRAWVELFNIDSKLFLPHEPLIYDWVSGSLGGGEPLYVEYSWDPETTFLLDLGVPTVLTRIGIELLQRGFTWFKVWYYPEGFMEGSPKIQGEKPRDLNQRRRNLRELCEEVESASTRWRDLAMISERAARVKQICVNEG
ncbi:MAG: DUF1122 family protein [Acidilobaceae archaeon]|nr:DUF1122 family protein [Acidilobaceae archaeon]MCX8165732.1 DUF1122 family protein [Acidilobaceae archaeon]MDW7974157.1 DUF1122 family protein [Sulfolobales archaeon]